MKADIKWLESIAKSYTGDARFVVYYAGHGLPDEKEGQANLLPSDCITTDISSMYSLNELYTALGNMPAKSIVLFLDACFSGTKRNGGMLVSTRGIAIKPKKSMPTGNLVVFSAAQGDETAAPFADKYHGLFTYFLLKKIQETSGDLTLSELRNYLESEVMKQSVIVNGKMQTPTTTASEGATDWKSWKLR